MRRVGLLLVLLFASGTPLCAQSTGSVRGQVSNETTGAPLTLATVEVVGTGEGRVAPTDSGGGYVLRGVPAGRRVLRARQLGYGTFEVEVLVPAGGEVVLDIALKEQPVALAPVEVRVGGAAAVGGSAGDTATVPPPELAMAGVRALESTPGLAELGLGESARGVPGQEPVDPSDVLYVRGAAADLKLVLLDGAPVYAPFHLGGLIPSFEPDVLGSARLYLGGAPARYDGGLSYVMDMQTRAGREEFHSSGALDLLSARVLFEGPLGGNASFLVGGRGIHDIGRTLLLRNVSPYAYHDGLLRMDGRVGEGNLSLTVFGNREEIQLDSVGEELASWANSAASLRYRGSLAGTDAELTAALGTFDAHLPIGGRRPVLAEGFARRARLAADLARNAGGLRFRYGASYDGLLLRYRVRPRLTSAGSPRSEDALGHAAGAYLDASWQTAPWLRLRGGLRADVFSLDPVPVFAPRLAATWLVSERAALTLAAGRYHQYVRPPEHVFAAPESLETDSLVASAALSIARGTHVSLTLDQELGEAVRLGLEGFFKRFDGLPAARGNGANASGVDIWVRRGGGERLTGWLGYSLAWVWSLEQGETASQNFAGRQLLSTGLAGPLGRGGHFDVRIAYGAGLPYTAVRAEMSDARGMGTLSSPGSVLQGNEEPPPLVPATPDRPYLRVDVDLSRTWTANWGARAMQITPYLRVLNALDRREALFYRYDGDPNAEPRALAPLPFLPVFGVEWRF